MKQSLTEIKRDTRHFCRNWWAYLTLFVSVDLAIQLVAIPLFRLVTTYVLQAGAIPFVSYQNIVTIVSQHPLVVVALLVELAILLLVVYWQFAIILLGVRDIQAGTIGVRQLLKESGQALRQLRASSLVVLLLPWQKLHSDVVSMQRSTTLHLKISLEKQVHTSTSWPSMESVKKTLLKELRL